MLQAANIFRCCLELFHENRTRPTLVGYTPMAASLWLYEVEEGMMVKKKDPGIIDMAEWRMAPKTQKAAQAGNAKRKK